MIKVLTLYVCLFQDMKMRTPREKDETISKKTPEFEVEDFPSLNIAKNTESSTFAGPLPVKKSDPFQKEQDHLAEEVRKRLTSILKYLLFSL